jgi:hypothetical protein
MRKACYEPNIQFDSLLHILEKPLPSSLMTDPEYFLSANEDAILHGLNESHREQRRMVMTRYAAVFGVFTAIAMLLTFSREVRAFAREVFYSVIEWFSPEQNESGVTFDIEDNTHLNEPDASALKAEEQIGFKAINEVDKHFSGSIFVLNGSEFVLSDGFIRNETICLNYQADGAKVQIIAEPIQDSGSVNYHFNDGSFEKIDVPSLGTFYYDLSGGTLFGGIMTNDSNLIIRMSENASPELLDQIVRAISLYR